MPWRRQLKKNDGSRRGEDARKKKERRRSIARSAWFFSFFSFPKIEPFLLSVSILFAVEVFGRCSVLSVIQKVVFEERKSGSSNGTSNAKGKNVTKENLLLKTSSFPSLTAPRTPSLRLPRLPQPPNSAPSSRRAPPPRAAPPGQPPASNRSPRSRASPPGPASSNPRRGPSGPGAGEALGPSGAPWTSRPCPTRDERGAAPPSSQRREGALSS